MPGRPLESCVCRCWQAVPSVTRSASSRRNFNSSRVCRKNGALPVFVPTASEELDELLKRIRNTIFLPSHLRRAQQKLVFQAKHREMLLSDPVIVEVGTEKHYLHPLDKRKDIPDSWGSVLKSMELMGTSQQDWTNFIGVLEGMKTAGRKWKIWQLERIIRTAGEAGMIGVILEAARRANRTGVVFADIRIVREAFWACRSTAVPGEWDQVNMDKAVRYVEQLAELLEEDNHLGRTSRGPDDPRRQADVIGAMLELLAVRAERHQAGEDVDGKVKTFVKRLVPHLQQAEVAQMAEDKHRSIAGQADYELCRWVPVLNALESSRKVLGEAFPADEWILQKAQYLKEKLKEAAEILRKSRETEEQKGRRRGLLWCKDLQL